ncbi:hypothetical protein [Cardiobacterium hominis]|jgi:hypothetical protein|uniref:hypothetical protein n=1 Tax=Cardiobacterium hominis TaxID=2718 RepID=UPI0028E8954D|nr:hypothetical protein [Cardiobacterium hominis]
MNRADAEKQLWADYRRALRERDYDPLTPYHADLYPLANKLNAMLTDIQNRMTCALQIAQGIQGEEPRVEAVRNEGKWQGSVVELALTFGNNIRAVMNIGVSGIHSLFYYDSTLVTAKTSRYADITAGDSISIIAHGHLDWLRGENHALQQYLAERRAAQADLP